MAPRRKFGYVRRLPSGKWQASYLGPDGERHAAEVTFPSEVDAERYLAMTARQIRSGEWTDLRQLGRRTLRECCEAYLDENPRVGRRWAETCRRNMRLHLGELLDLPISQIRPPTVRAWYAKQRRLGKSPSGTAQSYRFIRSVLNVAVADEAIPANPCKIPGAGNLKAAERPTATPEQVAALIEAITPRYRAAVVLAAWCGLRRGEVCALRVADVNLEEGTVRVHKNWVELLQAPVRFEKDPKTEAGKRTVNIPPHVIPILVEHQRSVCRAGVLQRRPRRAARSRRHGLPGVCAGPERGRNRHDLPRPAAHRTDHGRGRRRQPGRPHAPAGPLVIGGRAAVPARGGGPGQGDRAEPVPDGADPLADPPVPAAVDEAAQWPVDLGEGRRGPASSCSTWSRRTRH